MPSLISAYGGHLVACRLNVPAKFGAWGWGGVRESCAVRFSLRHHFCDHSVMIPVNRPGRERSQRDNDYASGAAAPLKHRYFPEAVAIDVGISAVPLASSPECVGATEIDRHLTQPIPIHVDFHRRAGQQRLGLESVAGREHRVG